MSVEFFGVGGTGQIGNIKKTDKSQSGAVKNDGSADSVQFSSVLQDIKNAQSSSDISTERAAKVAELKSQVADGSYKPDLQKVASSLLQFLIEEK